MKKWQQVTIMAFMLSACMLAYRPAQAQIPIIGLITKAVKKVIVAIDLKVQQLQNKTIALQNAEKALENKMALGNLSDISGWLDKEKKLYAQYYRELQKVRQVIADYELVRQVISEQGELVHEYKQAYGLFRRDKSFSAAEITYMGRLYSGLLQESINNLDEVLLAVNNFTTQMSDGERLSLIHKAAAGLQHNLDDLRRFNAAGIRLSLQRATAKNDRQRVKQLYGLQ